MFESDGSTIIATIGGQPQVVTFALDGLLARGAIIQEAIGIHLTPQDGGRIERALARLAAEFAGDTYAGQPCRLRLFPIRHAGGKLEDIRNETEANAAWLMIYELIAGRAGRKPPSKIPLSASLTKTLLKIPGLEKASRSYRQAIDYISTMSIYNNTNTETLLRGSGIVCPPFQSYMDNLMAYVRSTYKAQRQREELADDPLD